MGTAGDGGTITGGSGGSSSGSGGTVTITGGLVGVTYCFIPTLAFSGAGIIRGPTKVVTESLAGIECRCETKMLMRRGCNCGAMKAEPR